MSKHVFSWCMIGWRVHALKMTWIWHGKWILIASCEYWLASHLVSSLQSIEFLFRLMRYECYTCRIALLDRRWWLGKFIRSYFILTIMIACMAMKLKTNLVVGLLEDELKRILRFLLVSVMWRGSLRCV